MKSKLQAKIADLIMSSSDMVEGCNFYKFENNSGCVYRQGVVGLKEHSEISIVFSIPNNSNNIYIFAIDGDLTLARKILANIEENDDSTTPMKLGNVLLLLSPELETLDFCGVILLPINTSMILEFLPAKFNFQKIDYCFNLVVMITHEEHDVWKKHGHDTLMDYFSSKNKDLLSLS